MPERHRRASRPVNREPDPTNKVLPEIEDGLTPGRGDHLVDLELLDAPNGWTDRRNKFADDRGEGLRRAPPRFVGTWTGPIAQIDAGVIGLTVVEIRA